MDFSGLVSQTLVYYLSLKFPAVAIIANTQLSSTHKLKLIRRKQISSLRAMDSLDSAPQPMLPMSLGLSLSEPLASLIRIQEPHTPMAPTSLGTPNLCGGAELVVPPFSACLPSWQQAPVPAASTRSVAHGLMPLVSLSPEGSQVSTKKQILGVRWC